MSETLRILGDLLRFATVSRDSNLALIEYVRDHLAGHGITSQLIPDDTGAKANLYAVIGPTDVPGIMLSGHTDVVPVEGQAWSVDPFDATIREGRVIGRGSADMKSFIACVLAAVPRFAAATLTRPIHIALSYDEEVGCLGVRRMIDMLEQAPVQPGFCIIGEPTSMQIVVAHKAKLAAEISVTGREAHSSLAPTGLNAIHLALDLITEIRALQREIEQSGTHDDGYSVPYSTLHVGTISGGTALNIVPNHCRFGLEIRCTPPDQPAEILNRVIDAAARIEAQHRAAFPEASLAIRITNSYPGLDTAPDSEIVQFMHELLRTNSVGKVDFGTEGGLFQSRLALPTIVCGPGDIAQAHKPDEWIAIEQLARCDAFLEALAVRLSG